MHRIFWLLCLNLITIVSLHAGNTTGEKTRWNTSSVAFDKATTWTGQMQRQLDSLVNLPLFETTQVGVYVYDLTSGRDLFRVNAKQRMRPASNQKVVTAVAALHTLGANALYRTRLLLTGEVRDSVLWGNIRFVGGMDPMLSQGELMQMLRALHEAGVDSIAGNIELDQTFKDPDKWGWGWCWDDDMTPLYPLLVDKDDRFRQEVLSDLQIVGIKGGSEDRMVPYVPQAGEPEALLFGEVTHTVEQVLQRMMKKSDNYYAESMFYLMAANSGAHPATRKEAAAVVNKLIQQLGLDPSHYQVADGSGVSLYNYVTPELLVQLLKHAWRNESIRQALYPSLPIAGVDGTLEKRMRKTTAEGNIHAKTGTVTGVSSLSGYATTPEGHTLVFSIINQGIAKARDGRDWQDKVCTVLTK